MKVAMAGLTVIAAMSAGLHDAEAGQGHGAGYSQARTETRSGRSQRLLDLPRLPARRALDGAEPEACAQACTMRTSP
jgi:hypothetical protein